jgi:hypothetical protein
MTPGSYNAWKDASGVLHLEIEVDGDWQTFDTKPSLLIPDPALFDSYMPKETADALRGKIASEETEELYGDGIDIDFVYGWSIEVRFPPEDDFGPNIYGGIL